MVPLISIAVTRVHREKHISWDLARSHRYPLVIPWWIIDRALADSYSPRPASCDKPLAPPFVCHGQAAEAEARAGFKAISSAFEAHD
jgi:hypothetical protein